MSGIVCAVRGGPASQSTIRRGIELAKDEKRSLTFLYIVNLDFLTRTTQSRLSSLVHDMRQMGELILLMAVDRAAAAGVDAQQVVRAGKVYEEIVAFSQEVDADIVVVGEPLMQHQISVFNRDRVNQLQQALAETCQAKLILVA